MTPLARWFRNTLQKLAGVYYEGPEPPSRCGEVVALFSNQYPDAVKSDWVGFAAEHARASFREGWLRGFEYTERDPEEQKAIRNANPEVMADALDPDWRTSDPVQLFEPDEPVRASKLTEREEIEALFREAKS